MNKARWIRVTRCENVPPREGRAAFVGDRELAIFNLGDRFLAVENRCPHRGGPLSDGIVTGAAVVCPLHAWKVNLETGAVQRPADAVGCVKSYATRVADGIVLVEMPEADITVQDLRMRPDACRETTLVDTASLDR
jgi:nitrite reductase (NADH) small subunit